MRFWQFLRRQSIAVWIVAIFLFTILPVNWMLISGTQNYIQSVQTLTVSSVQSLIDLYVLDIDDKVELADRFLFSCEQSDTNFITVLQNRQDDHYTMSSAAVVRSFDSNLTLNSIDGCYFLLNPQRNPIIVGNGLTTDEKKEVQFFLQNDLIYEPQRFWQYITIDGLDYLMRVYHQNGIYYGSLIALQPLLMEIRKNLEIDYLELDFFPETLIADEMLERDPFVLCGSSSRTELVLRIRLDKEAIYRDLPLIRRIGIVFSFICLLILSVLLVAFHFLLVRPLKLISHALNHLEHGEQEYRMTTRFNGAELIGISNSFNRMADQIYHLKIESYETELEKNRVMLRNIQLQVRPHFLLNIFHLIFSMAQIGNFAGIQKMTLYLSSYFRHMFAKDDMHSLEVELKLVRGYLEVLEVQYPDCFEAEFTVDSRLLNVPVPTMILHNLLENIAKYTISVGNFIEITIRAYLRDRVLCLEVEDDGAGMDQSILQEIQAGNPVDKQDGRHIGLYNMGKRLKLFCTEEARLEVESELGAGTLVRILLPESYYGKWMRELEDGEEGSV